MNVRTSCATFFEPSSLRNTVSCSSSVSGPPLMASVSAGRAKARITESGPASESISEGEKFAGRRSPLRRPSAVAPRWSACHT